MRTILRTGSRQYGGGILVEAEGLQTDRVYLVDARELPQIPTGFRLATDEDRKGPKSDKYYALDGTGTRWDEYTKGKNWWTPKWSTRYTYLVPDLPPIPGGFRLATEEDRNGPKPNEYYMASCDQKKWVHAIKDIRGQWYPMWMVGVYLVPDMPPIPEGFKIATHEDKMGPKPDVYYMERIGAKTWHRSEKNGYWWKPKWMMAETYLVPDIPPIPGGFRLATDEDKAGPKPSNYKILDLTKTVWEDLNKGNWGWSRLWNEESTYLVPDVPVGFRHATKEDLMRPKPEKYYFNPLDTSWELRTIGTGNWSMLWNGHPEDYLIPINTEKQKLEAELKEIEDKAKNVRERLEQL